MPRMYMSLVAPEGPTCTSGTICVRGQLDGTGGTLGGVAATDRDFVHALFGNFPYVLAFVVILTLLLLARAFRSIVLAVKAAILNLASLAAAYDRPGAIATKPASRLIRLCGRRDETTLSFATFPPTGLSPACS